MKTSDRLTYPASCHPFLATGAMIRDRALARAAKARRDPAGFTIGMALDRQVKQAVADFHAPGAALSVAVWLGRADRLAGLAGEGLAGEVFGDGSGLEEPEVESSCRLQFITARGPRSYSPEREAAAYRQALDDLACGRKDLEAVAEAAKALVLASDAREARWSRDEIHFRLTAAVAEWVFWDEEPDYAR